MGLFDLFKKKKTTPTPAPVQQPVKAETTAKPKAPKTKETVRGTGMKYHMDEIMSLATKNPDYSLSKTAMKKKGINEAYEYIFDVKQFTLEEEPTNQYDPNAVKILADGKLVAYVKSGSCSHIKNLIKNGKIKSITGKICGGKSRVLTDYGDGDIDIEDFENDIRVNLELNLNV